MTETENFDVVIIGGSYAGLSAAMALGRSLQRVLIIDGGQPCNRQTPHSHNFITQDGEKPGIIAAKARAEVLKYSTVSIMNGIALTAKQTGSGFAIATEAGRAFSSRKLVLATGIKDIMPAIKGFADCWGISVVHCPYCHGYEIRNRKTAVMANGARALHLVSLVNNLTEDITILTNGPHEFSSEEVAKLRTHHIELIETEVAEMEHIEGQIKTIGFADGSGAAFEAAYASVPFTQHSEIATGLGCELTEQNHVKTDEFQKTTVAGVFACGDNATMMRSVASAVYTGNMAGAMVNMELTQERF